VFCPYNSGSTRNPLAGPNHKGNGGAEREKKQTPRQKGKKRVKRLRKWNYCQRDHFAKRPQLHTQSLQGEISCAQPLPRGRTSARERIVFKSGQTPGVGGYVGLPEELEKSKTGTHRPTGHNYQSHNRLLGSNEQGALKFGWGQAKSLETTPASNPWSTCCADQKGVRKGKHVNNQEIAGTQYSIELSPTTERIHRGDVQRKKGDHYTDWSLIQ